jgi:hypothetical protein
LLGANGRVKADLLPSGANQNVFSHGIVCLSSGKQKAFFLSIKHLLFILYLILL